VCALMVEPSEVWKNSQSGNIGSNIKDVKDVKKAVKLLQAFRLLVLNSHYF